MAKRPKSFIIVAALSAVAAWSAPAAAQEAVPDRLDRLEQRLDDLERRLDRIEQLLEQRAQAPEAAAETPAASTAATSTGLIKASMTDGAIRVSHKDWRISVTGVRVEEHVRLRQEKIIGGDKIMRSDRPLLVVAVEVSSPTGKGIDYHSWRRTRVGTPSATLSDDRNRIYSRYDADWIPEGGVQSRRVSGQGPVTDILLFEAPPIGETEHLVLHLPEAYLHGGLLPAGDDRFEFLIPASFVKTP